MFCIGLHLWISRNAQRPGRNRQRILVHSSHHLAVNNTGLERRYPIQYAIATSPAAMISMSNGGLSSDEDLVLSYLLFVNNHVFELLHNTRAWEFVSSYQDSVASLLKIVNSRNTIRLPLHFMKWMGLAPLAHMKDRPKSYMSKRRRISM